MNDATAAGVYQPCHYLCYAIQSNPPIQPNVFKRWTMALNRTAKTLEKPDDERKPFGGEVVRHADKRSVPPAALVINYGNFARDTKFEGNALDYEITALKDLVNISHNRRPAVFAALVLAAAPPAIIERLQQEKLTDYSIKLATDIDSAIALANQAIAQLPSVGR